MKNLALLTAIAVSLCVAGCDVQSGITQKSLEKYQPTPTPEKIVQAEAPIDPADVINADTAAEGPAITVFDDKAKKTINCNKYNKVRVNSDGNELKITGACSQIMVNGTQNTIVAAGAAEIVTYGRNNTISYSKYVNGKKPVVTDTSGTNTIEKVAAEANTKAPAGTKK